MNDLQKRSWAEIYPENIEHNYRAIRARLPEGCRFLGVVKADAYGHGAIRTAQLLQRCGADYLAVSCLDEAIELRDNGISMPILILGHTPKEYTGTLIRNNITQTVTCLAKALEYSEEAAGLGQSLRVHIKLDTGMSRLGYLCAGSYFNEGVENVIRSVTLPGLDTEGIFTHFAVADEPGSPECRDYTRQQFRLFNDVIQAVKDKSGFSFAIRHCASTGAVVNYPEMCLDMVRPGLLLYGYGDDGSFGLKPCMRLVTTVSTIKYYEKGTCVSYGCHYTTLRRTRMGVLAIGYADGLPRLSSGKCSYAAGDGFAPQCGNICMDMCMADLTDLPDIDVGSEIEIFGPRNDIRKLSQAAMTIPYELLCAVSKRVPRVYK